jgi:muconolactone delta-isomerase
MKPIIVLCVTALLLVARPAGADEVLFPFSLPADDITEGVTDLSFLNAKPADELVSVRDGHFYAGGKRIRFWSAIIIGGACFPSHEDATLVARRLASRGFNLVRIHLIDGHYAPNGLFDPAHKGELRILPAQLEKLDYLIAELKKRGLYVELPVNGYHWRNITGTLDYPGADLQKLSSFGSGIPLWSEKFVATEQQFAREFFGHVNPYTGLAYTAEPCVATMEIVNENGIICAWRGGHCRKEWPEAMVADLQTQWNMFLRTRYATTEQLRHAWAEGEIRADPRELLRNADFSNGVTAWGLQVVKPSAGAMEVMAGGGPTNRPCVTLTSDRATANGAFILFNQTGLAIAQGTRYTLSFLAKAVAPTRLSVSISMNHPPWSVVGLGAAADLGTTWQAVTLHFVGSQDEPAAKLMLAPPAGASRVSLAGFSLRKTDVIGLPAGETLEAGNATFPLTPEEGVRRTASVTKYFVDFLYEKDGQYFARMYAFLKHTLHCQHPVKGTQVDQYSSYFSQAQCDFVDAHGYWQHPNFPRKPWDPKDWTIGNSPMVNHAGETVVELAGCRVQGKPYNISEYCHPAPSTFCAEQIPTVAAFGALQDWDGITFHCWQELAYDWKRHEVLKLPADRIDSYFNIARHPVKLVTIPFGTLAFRRGDVAPAREELAIGVTLEDEQHWLRDQPRRAQGWRSFHVAQLKGATWLDAFTHRLSLALGSQAVPAFAAHELTRAQADTGVLAYDLSDPAAGVFTVNAPRAKAVIGFGGGQTFELGDVTLQPGPTRQRGYSVITASAVRGADFHAPGGAILVTATGYVENKGMGWNADKTSVGNQWGAGPVLCEGIPFELTLKTRRATAWALDGRGRRSAAVPGTATAGGVRFTFGPAYKTLWYEIATE